MARRYTAGSIEYDRPAADLAERQVDIPKLRAGGVGCIWLSEGAPGEYTIDSTAAERGRVAPNTQPAKRTVFAAAHGVGRLLRGFDAVRRLCAGNEELTLVTSVAEMEAAVAGDRIGVFMHTECLLLDDDLASLRAYHALGLRVTGLVHASPLDWIDCDKEQTSPGGLSPFGHEVVAELNRLGVLIDVSHASEQAIEQILQQSAAPIVASHVNARQLSGIMRNLPDAIIAAIAAAGGVVGIHCSSAFVDIECLHGRGSPAAAAAPDPAERLALLERVRRGELDPFELEVEQRGGSEAPQYQQFPRVGLERLLDHVDHLVAIAGIDHVGIGTDLQLLEDPVEGFSTVAEVPGFLAALRQRGYDPAAVAKIAGGNFVRVMRDVIG
jgi:membrane dipeptidase